MHESVAKEKSAKTLLIEAGNEANNGLLVSFPTKSSEVLVIFTRHLIRVKVSHIYKKILLPNSTRIYFLCTFFYAID